MNGRLITALATALFVVACNPQAKPDRGRYSCETDADCGPDYECKVQAAGGSLCFKTGTCGAETCNGTDDDCDGLTDETFAAINLACPSGKPGVCATGSLACVGGAETCVARAPAPAELCNGLDDDCDSMTDETFSLPTDNLNCGVCGRVCPAGTTCANGACRESECGDGIDNDADGGADCADLSCQGLSCFTSSDAGYVCGTVLTPDGGAPDAGAPDAGTPDAGTPDAGTDGGRFFCFPSEQCGDGADNDRDGLTDCADPECDNRLCASGTTCSNGVCPGPG